MLITIAHVDISKAGSGRNQYEVAEVTYSTNGNKRTFKIFSFVNPQVFKTISNANSGDTFTVTVGKNEKGYDTWTALEAGSAEAKNLTASTPTAGAKFSGDRESKDEREARQRYIIRQSSLSNAIQILTAGAKTPPKQDEVFALAEELVKFVYEATDPQDLFNQPNDLDTDIKY